jgi:hypothetical protein
MRAGLIIAVLAACGCNNPVYLAETAPIPTMPVMMGTGQAGSALYVLPVRRPTAAERQALAQLQMVNKLTMPVPWAQARDFDIEIEFSVANLDKQPITAYVTVDGGNEYGDYVPMLYIDPNANADDQTPPPPLIAEQPLVVQPGQTATGTIREDQTQESALNLEAITRYPDPAGVRNTPFMVIEHLSSVSPIGRAGVPAHDITPAHVRFAIGYSTDGKAQMDYTVRVRDHNGKLALPTDKNLYVSTAAMLAPPVAPPAAPKMGP